MTIAEIIEKAQVLTPTNLEETMMVDWINELEKEFCREVTMEEDDIPSYSPQTDTDKTPLMVAPYDMCYVYYLAAMIAYAQQEYDIYNNHMIMFNQKYNKAKVYYIKQYTNTVKLTNLW